MTAAIKNVTSTTSEKGTAVRGDHPQQHLAGKGCLNQRSMLRYLSTAAVERAGGFEEVSKLLHNKQNIEEYQERTGVVGRHPKVIGAFVSL